MGQFITGPNNQVSSDKPVWQGFKLNTKDRVLIEFHNSNVDSIISFYEKATGITIVKDPTLVGGMTVTSARKVSLSEALQILKTTLDLKGFDLNSSNNLLVIKGRNKPTDRPPFDPTTFARDPGGNQGDTPQTEIKRYAIHYANASQLAKTLNDVYTPTGAAANPFQNRGGGGGGFQFGGRGGPGGQNGRFPGGFQLNIGGLQNPAPVPRASSDDYTNSIIVNATPHDQIEVKSLITDLDQPAEDVQQTQVFKLQYAASDDMVAIIQNVLTANVPRGRGGATTGQQSGPAAFFNAARNSTPGAGQVTSDPKTNSLVVIATPDNLALVDKVIKNLDTPQKIQTSTFVIPLKNARSDTVQQLLQSAFGTRTGATATTNNRNTAAPVVRPGTQTTTGTSTGNRSTPTGDNLGGPESALQATTMPILLQDPTAESGELQTNVNVTQGLFGGGGGGGRQGGGGGGGQGGSTAQKPTVGYDSQGRVINVHDLTNQVTVISDPNTNSLIVVTTPENKDLVQKVIDQLDKIPEQVMIETIICEAELDHAHQLGVEWNLTQKNPFGTTSTTSTGTTNFGLQTATTPLQGLSYTITGGNVSAFINALQTDTKFQVLSTPRIFTSNNIQADINISQSIPYVVSSTPNALGQPTINYAFQDVGIVLTVIPHISSNGYVTMEVSQSANDLQGFTTFNAPIVNQRVADTEVSVKDGETVILGGMIRNTWNSTVNKVPLLGDIPILGNLFRSTSKSKQKTELLVFLCPHIVRDPAEAKKLKDEGMIELDPNIKQDINRELPNNLHLTTPPPPVTNVKKTGGN